MRKQPRMCFADHRTGLDTELLRHLKTGERWPWRVEVGFGGSEFGQRRSCLRKIRTAPESRNKLQPLLDRHPLRCGGRHAAQGRPVGRRRTYGQLGRSSDQPADRLLEF